MFISKKKYDDMLKRIEQLEDRVIYLEDNSEYIMFNRGRINFRSLCKHLPDIIREEINRDKKNTLAEHMKMLENK